MSENVQTFSGKVNVADNLLVGTSHFFVDRQNNRVGIGTSTPDASSMLDVTGNIKSGGTITATGGFSGNGSGLSGVNSDSGSWVNGSSSNIHLAVSTDNVGIGVLDPSHKLDVDGDINIASGSTLRVGGTPAVFSNWSVDGSDIYRSSGNVGIGTNNPQFKLHIGPVDDNHLYLASSNNLYGWIIDTDDEGNGSVPLRITKRSGGVDTEVLTIKNQDGNVGVGTSNPTNKLHISGTENQLVQIQNTSDTARLVLNGSSGTGGDLIFKQAGTTTWGIASIGDSLHFLGDDSTSLKRMTINNDGIVTTPFKPAFYAWDNSTSRSGITLTFNSTTYNIGSHFNTSTSRFRTPVAGTYIFAAVLAHDFANMFGEAYYSFYVDGSNRRDILEGMPTHDAHYETHGVYIVYLNANQYVDIRSRSGTNITFYNGNHGAYYRNCFQGALLG
jgi:hypothetical protein